MNKQILQIEHKLVKNPNWWEAVQLAIYKAWPRANPTSGRVEELNQGLPDFKSSALNHSATPPPYYDGMTCTLDNFYFKKLTIVYIPYRAANVYIPFYTKSFSL